MPYFATSTVTRLVLTPYQEKSHRYHVAASLEVLADLFNSSEPSLHSALLRELQYDFPYRIELTGFGAFDFTNEELENLHQGVSVHQAKTHDTAKLIESTNQLIVIRNPSRAAPGNLSQAQREVEGTVSLLKQSLVDQPRENWAAILKSKSTYFRYPVSLRSFDSIQLTDSERQLLVDGGILTRLSTEPVKYGSGVDYFYQLVTKSNQVISAGPISPFINKQIEQYRKRNLWLVAIVMLLALALWLLPSWRSSVALSNAAERFGEGDLDCRSRQYVASNFNKMTKAFNKMASTTQQLFADNKMMTLILSNELRDPISKIDKAVMALEVAISSKEQKKTTTSIRQVIEDLDQLTSDLVYFAKIQELPLRAKFERKQIGGWLEEQFATFTMAHWPTATHVSMRGDYSSRDYVNIDERHLNRAMQGLLFHFAKTEKCEIDVSCHRVGNNFLIRISCETLRKSEYGISEIGDIDQPTHDLADLNRLPYLIATKVIETHDGHLDVSRHENTGTTILTITLLAEPLQGSCSDE